MVILQWWSIQWRENDHVTEVDSLKEGELSCYRAGDKWRENGYVTEVFIVMEGEWSCYGGGQFKGGRMVLLQRQPV